MAGDRRGLVREGVTRREGAARPNPERKPTPKPGPMVRCKCKANNDLGGLCI